MTKRKKQKNLLIALNAVILLCIAALAVVSLTKAESGSPGAVINGGQGNTDGMAQDDYGGLKTADQTDGASNNSSGASGKDKGGDSGDINSDGDGLEPGVSDAGDKTPELNEPDNGGSQIPPDSGGGSDGQITPDEGSGEDSRTVPDGGSADDQASQDLGPEAGGDDDRLGRYADKLEGLDTEKVGWCFARKKDHSQSGTYEPFDITRYNAYYLNKNVTDEDKVIYMAFDCGYEYGYTPKIMDILKEHNVRAIFFVTKSFLDTSSDLAKRMKEEGHLVGNHTLHHPSLPEKSAEIVRDEVIGMEDLFREKTGYELDRYIRPPMGEYSESVLQELQNLGYTTIFWSMAYNDYDVENQPGREYVIDHFKNYYHNGAITLTHTVSESDTEALDEVLDFLEEQGFRFGTLDELKN